MDLFIEPDAAAINKALRSMQLLGCLLRNEQGYSWMAFCIVRGDIGKRLKKNSPPANLRTSNRKSGDRQLVAQAKFTANRDAKFTDNELIPGRAVKTPLYRAETNKRPHLHDHTNSPRPMLNTGRGLLRLIA